MIIPDTGCVPLIVKADDNPDHLFATWEHTAEPTDNKSHSKIRVKTDNLKTPMKTYLFIGLLSLVLSGVTAFADGLPDIVEKSSDGKWIFKAHWYGTKGYSWELDDAKTNKSYFAIANPETQTDQQLATRLSVAWSPENHYLAINTYYGRQDYQVIVLSLQSDPPGFVDWTAPTPASMIKPEDKSIWTGDGVANCSASKWTTSDTLLIGIAMRAELADKGSGQTYKIQSSREQSVQFTALKGQAIHDDPPEYDKQPTKND